MLTQQSGKPVMRSLIVVASLTIAGMTLHKVSDWWEKAWATRLNTELATTAHCTDLRSRKLMHDYYSKIAASRKPIYKGKIRVN